MKFYNSSYSLILLHFRKVKGEVNVSGFSFVTRHFFLFMNSSFSVSLNLIDFERLHRFPSTSTAKQGKTGLDLGLEYNILQNKLNKTLPKGNLLSLKGNWLLVNLKWYLRGGMNNNSLVGVHLPI